MVVIATFSPPVTRCVDNPYDPKEPLDKIQTLWNLR